MSKMRHILRENKAIIFASVLVLSLVIIILALYAMPDERGNEGYGPLAFLKGWTYILIIVMFVPLLVSAYIVWRYVSDKNRFENLMNSNSQAIFKRNQIEIERLALRLTDKEEERVVEAMKKYKIR